MFSSEFEDNINTRLSEKRPQINELCLSSLHITESRSLLVAVKESFILPSSYQWQLLASLIKA